jgi:hypothetical protein
MQSSNASIYSGGGPMYFHQHTASAGFYFVKSNGHYDAAFEDGDLRLYPNGGVTGVNGNILIHAQSTPASDAVMKIQNAPLALSRTYTIPEAGQNATFIMSESTNTIGIHARVSISSQMAAVGTGTNDDAPATYIGEYISTSVTSGNANSSTGSGQYFDICAMNLSPGDWDVSGIIVFTGGTQQGGSGGITTTAGNFSTGAIMGTNFLWILPGNATVDNGTSIPDVRASIASITTYYLKANITYSAGTAKAYGRLSARRRR